MKIQKTFISDIRGIILSSKENAAKAVDFQRVLMYWHIGKRIFDEEQASKNRADYGAFLTKHLAENLQPEFGSGFSVRQLELFRQFYRSFPIANTVYSQLSSIQI